MKICQDHATKEKTLQTMSNMSSAQIVSAGSSIHNKMTPALVGHLALHASTPVSYPGAVSPDQGERKRRPLDGGELEGGRELKKEREREDR